MKGLIKKDELPSCKIFVSRARFKDFINRLIQRSEYARVTRFYQTLFPSQISKYPSHTG